MNEKKIKTLEADIIKKSEKIDEIILELTKIKKTIRRRKQKHQHHRALSLRLNELKIQKAIWEIK